jgi:hypothetical protein
MQIAIELPDDIARQLGDVQSMSQRLTETLIVGAYLQGRLSHHQVEQVLQRDYWRTEELLQQYQAKRPYTLADLEMDREALAALDQT